MPRDGAEIDATGLFSPAVFHDFRRDLDYTAEEYVDLLGTYSSILAMAGADREGLLRCIAGMIGHSTITRSYLFQLRMARKLAGGAGFHSRTRLRHPTVTP